MRNIEKTEIDEILMEATKTKQERYPDYNIVYMAIPKYNPQEHKQYPGYLILRKKKVALQKKF